MSKTRLGSDGSQEITYANWLLSPRQSAMRLASFSLCCVFATLLAGCGLTEIRDRKKALEPLLATNAPLESVEARLKARFEIRRRGTPEWDRTMAKYTSSPNKQDQAVAAKLRKSEAAGHGSSISMQTWIFLDKEDRLVDFEVSAQ